MAIESISNDGAKAYTTVEVSTVNVNRTQSAVNADKPVMDMPTYSEDSYKGSVPSERTVKQAISDINKKINPNTVAEYGYHEKTNRVTIKIVDKDTDETIREFPAEETLDMIAKVWELAGMFLDEKG